MGPGFDVLGLALALHNDVEITFERGREVTVQTEAAPDIPDDMALLADDVPTDRRNYVAVGADTAFQLAGVRRPGYSITVTQRIPVSRGLGSSAAALAGGALAANALLDEPVPEAEIVFALSEVEGHTEQLAAATFGGLLAVAPPGEPSAPGRAATPTTFSLDLAPEIVAALAIPALTLETKLARSVLPHEVPFADAVANIAALAALSAGLADADPHLVGLGMRDRLHQGYRAELLPASLDVLAAARDAGAMGACWSGAGPAMLGLCEDRSSAGEVAHAMCAAFGAAGIDAAPVVVQVDLAGCTVLELDGQPPVEPEDDLFDEDFFEVEADD